MYHICMLFMLFMSLDPTDEEHVHLYVHKDGQFLLRNSQTELEHIDHIMDISLDIKGTIKEKLKGYRLKSKQRVTICFT